MPKGLVKTKADEKDWARAKRIAKKEYGSVRYGVVTKIFKNMKKHRGTKRKGK